MKTFAFTCVASLCLLAASIEARPAGPHDDAARMLAQARATGGLGVLDAPAFDAPGDGAIWVHGRTYKARIDANGFTYIPFLGSSAPQDYPVTFRLRSANVGSRDLPLHFDVEPIRDGTRVYLDHGSVVEIYDFTLDSVEQSFQVRRGRRDENDGAGGDLDVRLDVDSEMSLRTDEDGARFDAFSGSVHYGLPKSSDPSGLELATRSETIGRAFRFTVPAGELARASGDVVIDPFLSTVVVNASTYYDDKDPDIAYDVTNDRYLIAYEETFSQTDHDVLAQMIDGATGQPISGTSAYIDYTTDDWQQASVGNLRSAAQFLVAASVGPNSQQIKCRTRSAASLTMGAQFSISDNISPMQCSVNSTRHLAPVVGGDSTPGNIGLEHLYCVAWVLEGVWDSIDYPCPEIWFRTVRADGSMLNPKFLDGPMSFPTTIARTDDGTSFSLSISRSNGGWESAAEQNWNIAYWGPFHISDGTCCHSDYQVRIARVNSVGATTLGPTTVVSFSNPLPGTDYYAEVYSAVSVSTSQTNSTRKFMVAFDVSKWDGSVTPHIWGAIVDPSTIRGSTMAPPALYDLTNLESVLDGGLSFTEWHPTVECDGTTFVLGFKTVGGGLTGLGATEFADVTFFHSTHFQCTEHTVQAFQNPFAVGNPRCCAQASGDGSRHYTLFASTRWTGSPPQADPIAALHSD